MSFTPIPDADLADLDEPTRHDLIAEAFHTFGAEAARQLADRFAVPFEACREAIKRLADRQH